MVGSIWDIPDKIYQADVAILADAKLALRDLIDAVRERLGPGPGRIKEEVVAEIQQAKAKWQGEWMPTFTDDSVPINGYRVIHDFMQVVDRDRTIALHDAGGSRGYLSPFWVATRPRNYLGMGGMAALGWSLGAAIGAKLGRPDHLVFHVLGDGAFGMTGMEVETAVRMRIPNYNNGLSDRVIFASDFDLNRTAMSVPRFLARGRIRRIRHHNLAIRRCNTSRLRNHLPRPQA